MTEPAAVTAVLRLPIGKVHPGDRAGWQAAARSPTGHQVHGTHPTGRAQRPALQDMHLPRERTQPMTAVRISGTFRKDERPDNGLEAIAHKFVKDELGRHVVIGIVELHKVTKEPGEAPVPTVHFVAIEPLEEEADAALARSLLNGARKLRGLGLMTESLFDGGAGFDEPERTDPDLLEYAEEQAAQREAEEEAGPVEHEGATEGYAEELAEMKADLGITPTTCAVCSREIHYDPARDAHVDAEGWADGAEDGGHPHVPAERATVGSEAR